MHNSTKTELKRVFMDILDHSKPATCERCRHYDECFKGITKETVHISVCQFRAWDKDAEMDILEKAMNNENE